VSTDPTCRDCGGPITIEPTVHAFREDHIPGHLPYVPREGYEALQDRARVRCARCVAAVVQAARERRQARADAKVCRSPMARGSLAEASDLVGAVQRSLT
jgi:hypothetical protein